jgi:hypothetical protein
MLFSNGDYCIGYVVDGQKEGYISKDFGEGKVKLLPSSVCIKIAIGCPNYTFKLLS